MDHFVQITAIIEHFPMYSYFIIAALSLLEAFAFVGILVPGGVAVAAGGFLAAQGILNIWYLCGIVIIAVICGDGLSFFLGKKGWITFREGNRIFRPALFERGKQFFLRHGGKSIFLGRFIGFTRAVVPFIAGVFGFNTKVFVLWSVLSGILWTAAHIALGYFFGYAWSAITLWSVRASIFVGVLLGVALVVYGIDWIIVRRGRRFFRFGTSLWRSIVSAIRKNEDVCNLIERHRRFFVFLSARLNRRSFWGLPMTLLGLAFIYVLSLFVGIVEDIFSSSIIVSVDERIEHLMTIFRNDDLTQFFLWVTLLGKWDVVLVFIATIVCILFIWRQQFYIIPLLITAVGSTLFTTLGKLTFQRMRPETAMYMEPSFSFPSGHATLAVALYGFVLYILLRWVRLWKVRVNLFFLGSMIIVLIGLSRIYLGVHYFSDVWGGYLVGALWLIIGISIVEWWHAKEERTVSLLAQWKAVVFSIVLVALAGFIFSYYGTRYNPGIVTHTPEPESVVIARDDDFFETEQMHYTETLTGQRQEPISFIIIAQNDEALITAFERSGWYLADNVSVESLMRIARAALFKTQYLRAPMTPSFWNQRAHDFGFEKPTYLNNARQRHHARFWKTAYVLQNGWRIYVGTASFDGGVKWGITHKIDPDIDTEREVLFNDLHSSGSVQAFEKAPFVKPVLGKNFVGDPFFTDGEAYHIELITSR